MNRLMMAGAILAATVGCSRGDKAAALRSDGPVKLLVAAAVGGGSGAVYQAAGTVRALHRAELATRIMARIESIRVRIGDRVKAGQLLASFEKSGIVAEGSQAAAGLDLATTNLRRMERLYADSAIPVAQLEQAQAGFAQAKGHADAAGSELSYASLVAPFDGSVTARNAEPGDLAAPGRPILVIEDAGIREIVVGVPEVVAAAIRPRQRVAVRVGAEGTLITAEVTVVVPSADPMSRTVEVRLVSREPLMANVAAVAEFPVDGRVPGELAIPAAAVVVRGELAGVYLFEPDSTVRLRWIRLGRARGGSVDVLSGLERGDRVVADAREGADGMRARPAGGAR